jgi:hypothetical protein
VAGKIEKVSIARGDRVEPGATLAHVDDTLERLSRDATRDEVEVAKADLALVTAGSRQDDMLVRYEWDRCTAGGSACAAAPHTLRRLRFGRLDERGEPELGTDFRCTGTSPFEQDAKARRSCDPDTIALRRAADERTFVVTMRAPDAEEKPS